MADKSQGKERLWLHPMMWNVVSANNKDLHKTLQKQMYIASNASTVTIIAYQYMRIVFAAVLNHTVCRVAHNTKMILIVMNTHVTVAVIHIV